MNSIARRLVLPFVGFVMLGSLGLVWWRSAEESRQSQELFAAMARTNADFLAKQNLPPSDRTAGALSEVLGVQVAFAPLGRSPEGPGFESPKLARLPVEQPGVVTRLADDLEAVALPVTQGAAMFFVRAEPSRFGFLLQPRSFATLGAFWGLSLALAWLLARGIVRPLRTFAARLPRIAEESMEPIPEASRPDEIGQLARAYAETRAQLAVERGAREQAEKLATLGRMATGLAHEINNPVAAIKLHTQLLEGETLGAPPERLGIILAEAAKIEGLVSQWMFLARPQPPQTSPCEVADLVSGCIRALEPAASYAGVTLVQKLEPGLIVHADRRRLGQAVTNVIANAIHAMAAGGGTLTITAECMETTLHLRFADTGPGFSEAALARAMELFFSEKEGGMGIGLSVTAEILRAHHGRLLLANSEKGGATVILELPLAARPSMLHVEIPLST